MALHTPTPAKHVPAKTNEGWPYAIATIVLAIVCAAGAWYIHNETYKHPTDPSWHAIQNKGGAAH